jgi:hypothetical protein
LPKDKIIFECELENQNIEYYSGHRKSTNVWNGIRYFTLIPTEQSLINLPKTELLLKQFQLRIIETEKETKLYLKKLLNSSRNYDFNNDYWKLSKMKLKGERFENISEIT